MTDPTTIADIDEPSPPRPPVTRAESVKLIGGLVVVCVGLVVLLVISVVAMIIVHSTTSDVVAIATGSFGVVGAIVGAYFGIKAGSDSAASAVAGMRHEAAKAQAFAANVPKESAADAISQAKALAGGVEQEVKRRL
jgi:hypothetical protein